MAFTIKVFEKDEYLFSLLKMRLETMFPDAYIIDAVQDTGRSECMDFSEFTKIIYDQRNIDMSDFRDAVPIFDDRGVIDCRKIADKLGLITSLRKNADTISIHSGLSVALIPYVYMEDREALIDKLLADKSFMSDNEVRLDLMGKMRVPGPESTGIRPGGMTKLIELAGKKSFKPEDILACCNMDKNGFLTPGATSGEDDIYDAGLAVIKRIVSASVTLTKTPSPSTDVLAVFEGFRSSELTELVSSFDEVILLLPSRNSQEDLGTRKLVSGMGQSLTGGRLTVRYADDISSVREELDYEQAL
jgi:hypothetical protein